MSKEIIKDILGRFYGQRIQLMGGRRKLIDWSGIARAVNRKFRRKQRLRAGDIFQVTRQWTMTAYSGLLRKR